MFGRDLNKIYTDWIKGYFKMGYEIDTECRCGHQGEITKTILVNPERNKRFCVWLENKGKYENKYVDSIVLKIGWQPIENGFWLSKLKVIHEEYYFNVSHKWKKWYITDFDEALKCQEKYFKRYGNRNILDEGEVSYNYNSKRFIDYVWEWFKNNRPKGMSKYRKKDIKYIQKYKPPLADMIYFCDEPYFFLYFKDGNFIAINK